MTLALERLEPAHHFLSHAARRRRILYVATQSTDVYTHFIAYHKAMAAAKSPEAAKATNDCPVTAAPERTLVVVPMVAGAGGTYGSSHPQTGAMAPGRMERQSREFTNPASPPASISAHVAVLASDIALGGLSIIPS
jgi:hypothetical protein